MRKICLILLLLLMMVCQGCQWRLRPSDGGKQAGGIAIDRFDRVESVYLTLADFAALHQMKTDYPVQMRTLVEDVLRLGPVNDPELNSRLLVYFSDTTLQTLISDVERQYGDVDDLNRQLTAAFGRLRRLLPEVETPRVYAQIGSLDQSIVISDGMLGISLDKYLGADHPVYLRYGYTERQRSTMTRDYIVPDCLGFYLLSLFPMPAGADSLPGVRDGHMAKIQTVVNRAMGRKVFTHGDVVRQEAFLQRHPDVSIADFLCSDSVTLAH